LTLVTSFDIDIDAILTAIVWPVFAGIVLILIFKYRQNIGPFIKELKVSKLSVGPVSVELAEAKGFEPDLTTESYSFDFDLRHELGTLVAESENPAMWKLIEQADTKDFAIFDLGSGKNWLSSRLFLFTIVLHHLYHLKSIVFLSTKDGVSNHFLGIAEPEQVRYALGKRYDWFENAIGKAYEASWKMYHGHFGYIDTGNAKSLVENFLEAVQLSKEDWEKSRLKSSVDESQWTLLKQKKGDTEETEKWEHSDWVTPEKLEDILGDALDKSSWIAESELRAKSREGQVLAILSHTGHYVVVLDEGRRFDKGRVIDRVGLALESLQHLLSIEK
jgi:hypothetical protein